jgi:AcrR family transcriptional regulator
VGEHKCRHCSITSPVGVQLLYSARVTAIGPPLLTPPPSRRERRKLETRRSIRTAALTLFAEKGFEATTITDITDAADVAPRTFFLHFATKETVLVGDHRERMERFRVVLLARPADEDAFTALRRTIVESIPTQEAEIEELALAARLMVQSPQLLALVAGDNAVQEASIAKAIGEREGMDPDGMYPKLLAAFSGTAIRIGLTTWYTEGRTRPPTEVIDNIVASLGRGFAV